MSKRKARVRDLVRRADNYIAESYIDALINFDVVKTAYDLHSNDRETQREIMDKAEYIGGVTKRKYRVEDVWDIAGYL